MQLPQLKKYKWNYLAIAFFFPAALILILMMLNGCTPFGNYSYLYSDCYHQYYPFFKEFRQTLLNGDSLLYSWSVGMGVDYLGMISYYLASPLNLLSVFVPEGWLLEFFTLLTPIKLGFASLFFAIFLKRLFKKDDLSLVLFGSFYGLCAWALGYQWNIMWVDTFALLPLVMLGMISLLRDKKFILYTFTLFLAVFSNYYIGFFVCIFVLLSFICYQICCCRSIKRFFADLFRIAFFSILAIGMTAVLELPALAALQTTQSSVNKFPTKLDFNIVSKETWSAFFDAMKQVAGNMNGGLVTSFKEGLPNLYCGVGTISLAFLFLTAKKVKIREKICCVFLLLFFMASFIIRQLDYIWHGFHFPNMIPYRFSFLFSFVMLYMAYRAYLMRYRFKLWQIVVSAVLSLGIIFCYEGAWNTTFIAYNFAFFAAYIAVYVVFIWKRQIPENADKEKVRKIVSARKARRNYANIALATIMAVELAVNVSNFGTHFTMTGISNYPRGLEDTASVIRIMDGLYRNPLFYRAETTHTQTLNDGALNNYNGLSTFTSSANVKVTEFTRILGFSAKNTYNRYCFEDGSPVSNLFLNLLYMIDRNGIADDNDYFDEIYKQGNIRLLQNNAYLPLGFLAESELGELEFIYGSSSFVFQNKLFKAATGLKSDVWDMVSENSLSIDTTNVTLATQSNSGYCTYIADPSGGTIIYTYDIFKSGFMCMDMTMNAKNSFTVWKNGVQLYSESISLQQTFAISQVEAGDQIQIKITCKGNENSRINLRAAILNDKIFRQGYDILNASTLNLTSFSSTCMEGTINCNRSGLMYTSVPQNGENWSVYVDGEKADIVLVGDVMIGVELTEGEHEIRIVYHNAAYSLGLKITLLCAFVYLALILWTHRNKFISKNGKYQK